MADTKKVLIWIGAGCGTLFLLVVVTCVGLGYYAKKRVEAEVAKNNPQLAEAISKGGIKGAITGGSGQMVAAGVGIYGGTVPMSALPEEERKDAAAILERLVKVGAKLQEADIKALAEAMDRTQKTHKNDKSLPTTDEARAFFAEVKVVAEKYQP